MPTPQVVPIFEVDTSPASNSKKKGHHRRQSSIPESQEQKESSTSVLNIEIGEPKDSGSLTSSIPTIHLGHPTGSILSVPPTDSVLSPSLPIPEEGENLRLAAIREKDE